MINVVYNNVILIIINKRRWLEKAYCSRITWLVFIINVAYKLLINLNIISMRNAAEHKDTLKSRGPTESFSVLSLGVGLNKDDL